MNISKKFLDKLLLSYAQPLGFNQKYDLAENSEARQCHTILVNYLARNIFLKMVNYCTVKKYVVTDTI